MTRHARRYRRIARTLSAADLRGVSMDSGLDPQDLLLSRQGQSRFLDYYGESGVLLALERYGFVREARQRGYDPLSVEAHASEDRHTLLVFGRPVEGGAPVRLAEAAVRRDRLVPTVPAGLPSLQGSYEVLTIDWLCLRHPRASFTPERPQLPGQDAPGLGLGEEVFELLCRTAERLRLEALLSTAEYFHNAVLYLAPMPFLDPEYAGQLRALIQVLMIEQGLTLAQASWAVEWGMVYEHGADAPFRWHGEVQLWPRAPSLEAYLRSGAYFEKVAAATSKWRFRLDRAAFDERWELERDVFEGRLPEPPLTGSP